MKIINLKIFNPYDDEIRDIDFKENGASVIFGKIEEPTEKQKTTNSIGKTLLLRFIGYILGKKEKKKDYSDAIYGWKLVAKVLYNGKEYEVERILGDSKSIKLNGENITYSKYLQFFDINLGMVSKQISYTRRKNIISEVQVSPTKDDIKNTLLLLKISNILDLYNKMRALQERVKSIKDYSKQFKEDLKVLKEEEFFLEQEKIKLETELKNISSRIENLEISQDSMELMEVLSRNKYELKLIKNKQEEYQLRIRRLKDLIHDIDKSEIKSSDVLNIYQQAKIDLPDMIKRDLNEVQMFYDSMFEDKKETYLKDINNYQKTVDDLDKQIQELSKLVDSLAARVADNNLFTEAMGIYQTKNDELLNVESRYSMIQGSISNLSQKKEIENDINTKYIELEDDFKQYESLISEYRKYIYDLVSKVYGSKNKAFFDISISSSKRRVESSPITFNLKLEGDFGEGISAVKNILMDILIFNYNNQIEYLVHDSSCFEGIDKRQLSTLINIIHSTAKSINKQYIFSINEYHISKDDSDFMKIVKDTSSITLSEEETLLLIRF